MHQTVQDFSYQSKLISGTRARMHTHRHTHARARAHTHTHIHTHTHTHTNTHTHTHTHTHTQRKSPQFPIMYEHAERSTEPGLLLEKRACFSAHLWHPWFIAPGLTPPLQALTVIPPLIPPVISPRLKGGKVRAGLGGAKHGSVQCQNPG